MNVSPISCQPRIMTNNSKDCKSKIISNNSVCFKSNPTQKNALKKLGAALLGMVTAVLGMKNIVKTEQTSQKRDYKEDLSPEQLKTKVEYLFPLLEGKENYKYARPVAEIIASDKRLNSRSLYNWNVVINANQQTLQLVKNILYDERLYGNEDIECRLCNILDFSNEGLESLSDMTYKIYSDKKLSENKNIKDNLFGVINVSPNALQARCEVADIFVSDEKLYSNEAIKNCLGKILSSINSPDAVQIFRKIANNKNLYENKNVMENIANILDGIESPEAAKIANKILDDKNLYENEKLMSRSKQIICYINTPENEKIMEMFLSSEKFYKNLKILEHTSQLLYDINLLPPKYREMLVNMASEMVTDENFSDDDVQNLDRMLEYMAFCNVDAHL